MKSNIHIKQQLKGTFLVMSFFLLNACVSVKEFEGQQIELPKEYANTQSDIVNQASTQWQIFFKDSNLTDIIETALAQNQELNIMLQKIAISQNEVQTRKGEYLPFIGISGASELEKVGEFTRNGAVEKALKIREDDAFPEPLKNVSLGLSATWELDIWKKLRNSKKASVYEYLATVEGKNFMVTQLISEIAITYYELLSLDNQLVILDQNLSIQENALQMIKLQKQAARVTELAVKRFEAEVFGNRSKRFLLKQQILETENALNFLVGRTPQTLNRLRAGFLDIEVATMSAGIPSDLLLNRPDIKKASLEIEMRKLDLKVAKAQFYPSIGLRAGLGFEAFKSNYLFNAPASVFKGLALDLVGPLINRNAIKAHFKTANSKQIQAMFDYQKVVLSAFIEVANQWSKMDNLRESYTLKEAQVNALTHSIGISLKLFQSARAEYTEVLLVQREALESKMELVETKKEQLVSRVKMYQALGGGWQK